MRADLRRRSPADLTRARWLADSVRFKLWRNVPFFPFMLAHRADPTEGERATFVLHLRRACPDAMSAAFGARGSHAALIRTYSGNAEQTPAWSYLDV
jgi:hypothetical protein